ncbi:cytochrome P450 [Zopfia rhizophila CBS 207.26]|uniref:Cytochrome P450 n=1 Tax=Zopfia rhizophila CBS 207.26 TaxID=1314779 RepID=A0A6A6E208_9PEZI|nr:cytochrome P450 [Zopfia rhizophila CBS 207.26]
MNRDDILRPLVASRLMTKGILLGGTLALLVILYAFYNAFLHLLRRFPGPRLWAAFRFPYVISVHRGDIHRQLKTFHDIYGPVVRIAPNELSYIDGAAWKDVYANRPGHLPFPRNPTWFKNLKSDEPKSIMGSDEEAHSRMRRTFANSFSEKSLKDQSPVIESYAEELMNQLKSPTSGRQWKEKTVDLVQWLDFLMFDISGDLSFGESFDCIKNGKAHPWVEIAHGFGKWLALIASINLYPPMNKLLRYILPKKLVQRQLDHREMSAAKARKRLALDTDRPDFVTPMKKFNDQKASISAREWEINMAVLVFAGSETTGSALSGILRELVQNRGVMYSLTQEIRRTFGEESQITISSTSCVPYLNAVINEGLRLTPPVVIGVPRVVPKGGDQICGQWVPEGTYVSFNQFPANRSSRNFRHPNSFIPERFLHQDPRTDDMSTFQPFGLGRHSCIGMKHAYAEMRLILARLLYSFDITLADKKDRWDWGQQQTFIFWDKKPLKVILRRSGRV